MAPLYGGPCGDTREGVPVPTAGPPTLHGPSKRRCAGSWPISPPSTAWKPSCKSPRKIRSASSSPSVWLPAQPGLRPRRPAQRAPCPAYSRRPDDRLLQRAARAHCQRRDPLRHRRPARHPGHGLHPAPDPTRPAPRKAGRQACPSHRETCTQPAARHANDDLQIIGFDS